MEPFRLQFPDYHHSLPFASILFSYQFYFADRLVPCYTQYLLLILRVLTQLPFLWVTRLLPDQGLNHPMQHPPVPKLMHIGRHLSEYAPSQSVGVNLRTSFSTNAATLINPMNLINSCTMLMAAQSFANGSMLHRHSTISTLLLLPHMLKPSTANDCARN